MFPMFLIVIVLGLGLVGLFLTANDLRRYGVVSGLRRLNQKNRDLKITELGRQTKQLSTDELKQGLGELYDFAQSYRPDWIVGIHTGGRLLASLVAEHIGLDSRRCVFAHTEFTRADEFRIRDANRLVGRILLVDDITRTGSTLRAVNRYLMQRVMKGDDDITDVQYAVMVVVRNVDELGNAKHVFDPHWAKYVSSNSFISLPWSLLSDNIKAEFDNKFRRMKYNEYYTKLHERIVSDNDASLAVAKLALADARRFREELERGNLLEFASEAAEVR